MTLASVLYGGGSGTDYASGALYRLSPAAVGTSASTANEDNLVPFIARKAVTVDSVAWYRDNTNAGNAYVGIYSLAGVLLTDCAVDADTTTGWHLVSTTNITLMPGRIYFGCWNASADIAGMQNSSSAAANTNTDRFDIGDFIQLGITGGSVAGLSLSYVKARTNAALLSSLTMTGWATDNVHPPIGFVAA